MSLSYDIEYSSSQSTVDTITQHHQADGNLVINLGMDSGALNDAGIIDLELNDAHIFESGMDQTMFTTKDLTKCARNLQKHFIDPKQTAKQTIQKDFTEHQTATRAERFV
jgi:hypothetical protein